MKPMTNDDKHEVEDFSKTLVFESGQFAIVDAEVLKAIKDKIPLADKAIFVATKQARGSAAPFKIMAEYDDATLRKLIIEPAPADVGHENCETPVKEGIQLQGHEKDPVKKKISQISRKGGGAVPKTGDRDYRNDGDSARGNPRNKLTKGKSSVEARVGSIGNIQGARRDNYGQPRARIEEECLELFNRVKSNTIDEEFLDSIEHIGTIRQALVDIRDNAKVQGKSFDLVYESIQVLDAHTNYEYAANWVQNLIDKGAFNV